MILGDSLQVMASLAEREGLRGKVQCIYLDPPYGIKFNSNFQWSTTSRDVKDGKADHITREPEQVKAFRDTWRYGIHSYLTVLRDRFTVARDLLTDSGSIFVQIGDENVHRVRAVLDEVFGETNFVSQIVYRTTTGKASAALDSTRDFVLWFAKRIDNLKFRRLYFKRFPSDDGNYRFEYRPDGTLRSLESSEVAEVDVIASKIRVAAANPLTSQSASETTLFDYKYQVSVFNPGKGGWKTNISGMDHLRKASRLHGIGKTLRFIRPISDFDVQSYNDIWDDTRQSGFGDSKLYVVQTASRVIERCMLMATDPGDLVLDPTCGSGTTAYVAEQWGRRWITIDTSRVALALARARIMGARYPYYLLADSREGQIKEAEVTRTAPSSQPVHGNIRHGFVYERVPHITLKSIANNTEIDVIWDRWQATLERLREQLNAALYGWADRLQSHRSTFKPFEEWEIPRAAEDPWPTEPRQHFQALKAEQAKGADARPSKIEDSLRALNKALKRDFSIETLPDRPVDPWPEPAAKLHADWWQARIARQKEIDDSIAAKADFEYLYDKPYTEKKDGPCRRPLHRREPVSPPGARRRRERRPDRPLGAHRRPGVGIRREADLPADDPGEPEGSRGAAGPQGGPDQLHLADALARGPRLR